jgi:hypothetical protein
MKAARSETANGRMGEWGDNAPDRWGDELGAPEDVAALPANRAGFEPFRAFGIAAALPNLTRAVATTRVSLQHSAMPPLRSGSKPARDNLNG